ncbi:LacI family DNA-binding transcriptional regulator [Streptomyces sp. RGM 3693]|uniref:LacI family DNA-binding transcriptional regulator n=1 Tax=Streptomyces sp. RGM 3693 TaxID=3413284 RepID=UPI003D2992E4
MADKARPTSRDVAREAGVSQATVSLVFGEKWHGRVSERIATAVRDAANTLGYRPNLAARNLRTGRTRTVMLIVPALTNEYYARLYTGAAQVAAQHGLGVVLYPSPSDGRPARNPFVSARASLDGVLASSMASDVLSAFDGDGLPLVMLDSDPANSRAATTVNLDVVDGMRQVATHLLALGHRRIAHIAAEVDSWTFAVRSRALAATLDGTGAELRTVHAALTMDAGRRAAETVLHDSGRRPTALLCDFDFLAVGALKAARRLGLRVPEDVSVTGFDDLTIASAVEPELTTVRLPAKEVGRQGMTALVSVLADEHPGSPADVPVSLVVRGSTAAPPA